MGGLTEYAEEQEIVLLSVAPMVDYAEDDDDKEKLAVSFNAQKQVDHFREMFKFYGVKFDEWCVCLIGDNASVNVKTAELCDKPHVGCKNHKLNLEVKSICDADNNLKSTLDQINNHMVSLRTLKNSAALRNLTDLRPMLCSATRWRLYSNVLLLKEAASCPRF
jgi:hypothetical protein